MLAVFAGAERFGTCSRSILSHLSYRATTVPRAVTPLSECFLLDGLLWTSSTKAGIADGSGPSFDPLRRRNPAPGTAPKETASGRRGSGSGHLAAARLS